MEHVYCLSGNRHKPAVFTAATSLQFCGWIAAAAGIPASALGQVVEVLDKKPRLPVGLVSLPRVYLLQRVVHSLVAPHRLGHYPRQDLAGLHRDACRRPPVAQAEAALHETMTNHKGDYLMLVEGSVPTEADGVYCCIGGRTALDIVTEAAADAKAIVAWGSCASNGCIQAANPNPTGATPIHQDRLRQADHQRPGLPTHWRGDGRHDCPPAGLRSHPGTGRAGPSQGILFTPCPRHVLPSS